MIVTDLDRFRRTLTIQGKYSKNKTTETLPLKKEFAEILQEDCKDKTPNVLFGRWDYKTASRMIKTDLKSAGIPYRSEEGDCDFHSLRHSAISNWARSGMAPQLCQQLARHSDINLTMKAYTHIGLEQLDQAIQQIPSIQPLDPGLTNIRENRAKRA